MNCQSRCFYVKTKISLHDSQQEYLRRTIERELLMVDLDFLHRHGLLLFLREIRRELLQRTVEYSIATCIPPSLWDDWRIAGLRDWKHWMDYISINVSRNVFFEVNSHLTTFCNETEL